MNQFQINCPHCDRLLDVGEATTESQRAVGLVYLSTKCRDCNAVFDSAGIGEENAVEQMNAKLRSRIGTSAEQWRIRPVSTVRKGPMRR